MEGRRTMSTSRAEEEEEEDEVNVVNIDDVHNSENMLLDATGMTVTGLRDNSWVKYLPNAAGKVRLALQPDNGYLSDNTYAHGDLQLEEFHEYIEPERSSLPSGVQTNSNSYSFIDLPSDNVYEIPEKGRAGKNRQVRFSEAILESAEVTNSVGDPQIIFSARQSSLSSPSRTLSGEKDVEYAGVKQMGKGKRKQSKVQPSESFEGAMTTVTKTLTEAHASAFVPYNESLKASEDVRENPTREERENLTTEDGNADSAEQIFSSDGSLSSPIDKFVSSNNDLIARTSKLKSKSRAESIVNSEGYVMILEPEGEIRESENIKRNATEHLAILSSSLQSTSASSVGERESSSLLKKNMKKNSKKKTFYLLENSRGAPLNESTTESHMNVLGENVSDSSKHSEVALSLSAPVKHNREEKGRPLRAFSISAGSTGYEEDENAPWEEDVRETHVQEQRKQRDRMRNSFANESTEMSSAVKINDNASEHGEGNNSAMVVAARTRRKHKVEESLDSEDVNGLHRFIEEDLGKDTDTVGSRSVVPAASKKLKVNTRHSPVQEKPSQRRSGEDSSRERSLASEHSQSRGELSMSTTRVFEKDDSSLLKKNVEGKHKKQQSEMCLNFDRALERSSVGYPLDVLREGDVRETHIEGWRKQRESMPKQFANEPTQKTNAQEGNAYVSKDGDDSSSALLVDVNNQRRHKTRGKVDGEDVNHVFLNSGEEEKRSTSRIYAGSPSLVRKSGEKSSLSVLKDSEVSISTAPKKVKGRLSRTQQEPSRARIAEDLSQERSLVSERSKSRGDGDGDSSSSTLLIDVNNVRRHKRRETVDGEAVDHVFLRSREQEKCGNRIDYVGSRSPVRKDNEVSIPTAPKKMKGRLSRAQQESSHSRTCKDLSQGQLLVSERAKSRGELSTSATVFEKDSDSLLIRKIGENHRKRQSNLHKDFGGALQDSSSMGRPMGVLRKDLSDMSEHSAVVLSSSTQVKDGKLKKGQKRRPPRALSISASSTQYEEEENAPPEGDIHETHLPLANEPIQRTYAEERNDYTCEDGDSSSSTLLVDVNNVRRHKRRETVDGKAVDHIFLRSREEEKGGNRIDYVGSLSPVRKSGEKSSLSVLKDSEVSISTAPKKVKGRLSRTQQEPSHARIAQDLSQERSLVSERSKSRGKHSTSATVFEKDSNSLLIRKIGENHRKRQSNLHKDFGGALQDSSSMGRPMGVLRKDLSDMSEHSAVVLSSSTQVKDGKLKKGQKRRPPRALSISASSTQYEEEENAPPEGDIHETHLPLGNEPIQRTYAEERNDYTCEDGDSSSSTLLVDVNNQRRHKRGKTVDGEAVDHVFLRSREEEKGGNRIDYVGSLSPVRKSGGKSSLSVLKDNEVSMPTAPKKMKGRLSRAQQESSHSRTGEDLSQGQVLVSERAKSRGELSTSATVFEKDSNSLLIRKIGENHRKRQSNLHKDFGGALQDSSSMGRPIGVLRKDLSVMSEHSAAVLSSSTQVKDGKLKKGQKGRQSWALSISASSTQYEEEENAPPEGDIHETQLPFANEPIQRTYAEERKDYTCEDGDSSSSTLLVDVNNQRRHKRGKTVDGEAVDHVFLRSREEEKDGNRIDYVGSLSPVRKSGEKSSLSVLKDSEVSISTAPKKVKGRLSRTQQEPSRARIAEDLSQEQSLVSEHSKSRGELSTSATFFEKDSNSLLIRKIGENHRKRQSNLHKDFGGALQDSSSMGRPMGVLRKDLSDMSEHSAVVLSSSTQVKDGKLKKGQKRRPPRALSISASSTQYEEEENAPPEGDIHETHLPFANEPIQRTYAEERNDYTCEDGDSSSSTLLVDVNNQRRHKRGETVDGEAVDHVFLRSREEEKGGNRIDYVGSLSPVRKSGEKFSLSVLKDAPKMLKVEGRLSRAQDEPSRVIIPEDLSHERSFASERSQTRGDLSTSTAKIFEKDDNGLLLKNMRKYHRKRQSNVFEDFGGALQDSSSMVRAMHMVRKDICDTSKHSAVALPLSAQVKDGKLKIGQKGRPSRAFSISANSTVYEEEENAPPEGDVHETHFEEQRKRRKNMQAAFVNELTERIYAEERNNDVSQREEGNHSALFSGVSIKRKHKRKENVYGEALGRAFLRSREEEKRGNSRDYVGSPSPVRKSGEKSSLSVLKDSEVSISTAPKKVKGRLSRTQQEPSRARIAEDLSQERSLVSERSKSRGDGDGDSSSSTLLVDVNNVRRHKRRETVDGEAVDHVFLRSREQEKCGNRIDYVGSRSPVRKDNEVSIPTAPKKMKGRLSRAQQESSYSRTCEDLSQGQLLVSERAKSRGELSTSATVFEKDSNSLLIRRIGENHRKRQSNLHKDFGGALQDSSSMGRPMGVLRKDLSDMSEHSAVVLSSSTQVKDGKLKKGQKRRPPRALSISASSTQYEEEENAPPEGDIHETHLPLANEPIQRTYAEERNDYTCEDGDSSSSTLLVDVNNVRRHKRRETVDGKAVDHIFLRSREEEKGGNRIDYVGSLSPVRKSGGKSSLSVLKDNEVSMPTAPKKMKGRLSRAQQEPSRARIAEDLSQERSLVSEHSKSRGELSTSATVFEKDSNSLLIRKIGENHRKRQSNLHKDFGGALQDSSSMGRPMGVLRKDLSDMSEHSAVVLSSSTQVKDGKLKKGQKRRPPRALSISASSTQYEEEENAPPEGDIHETHLPFANEPIQRTYAEERNDYTCEDGDSSSSTLLVDVNNQRRHKRGETVDGEAVDHVFLRSREEEKDGNRIDYVGSLSPVRKSGEKFSLSVLKDAPKMLKVEGRLSRAQDEPSRVIIPEDLSHERSFASERSQTRGDLSTSTAKISEKDDNGLLLKNMRKYHRKRQSNVFEDFGGALQDSSSMVRAMHMVRKDISDTSEHSAVALPLSAQVKDGKLKIGQKGRPSRAFSISANSTVYEEEENAPPEGDVHETHFEEQRKRRKNMQAAFVNELTERIYAEERNNDVSQREEGNHSPLFSGVSIKRKHKRKENVYGEALGRAFLRSREEEKRGNSRDYVGSPSPVRMSGGKSSLSVLKDNEVSIPTAPKNSEVKGHLSQAQEEPSHARMGEDLNQKLSLAREHLQSRGELSLVTSHEDLGRERSAVYPVIKRQKVGLNVNSKIVFEPPRGKRGGRRSTANDNLSLLGNVRNSSAVKRLGKEKVYPVHDDSVVAEVGGIRPLASFTESSSSQTRGDLSTSTAKIFEKDDNGLLLKNMRKYHRKRQSNVFEDFGGALQDSSNMVRAMHMVRKDISDTSKHSAVALSLSAQVKDGKLKKGQKGRPSRAFSISANSTVYEEEENAPPEGDVHETHFEEQRKRRKNMQAAFVNELTERIYAEERNNDVSQREEGNHSALFSGVSIKRKHKRKENVYGEALGRAFLRSREEEKRGNSRDYVGSPSPVRMSGGKSSLSVLKDNEVSIPTAPKNSEVKGHLSQAQEEPSHARMGEDLNQKLSLAREHLQSRGELSLVTSHEDLGRERSAVYPVIKRQKVGLNVNSKIVFEPPRGKRGGRRSTANDNLSLLGNVRNSSAVKRLGKEKVYPVHDDSVVAEVGGIRPLASFTESSSSQTRGDLSTSTAKIFEKDDNGLLLKNMRKYHRKRQSNVFEDFGGALQDSSNMVRAMHMVRKDISDTSKHSAVALSLSAQVKDGKLKKGQKGRPSRAFSISANSTVYEEEENAPPEGDVHETHFEEQRKRRKNMQAAFVNELTERIYAEERNNDVSQREEGNHSALFSGVSIKRKHKRKENVYGEALGHAFLRSREEEKRGNSRDYVGSPSPVRMSGGKSSLFVLKDSEVSIPTAPEKLKVKGRLSRTQQEPSRVRIAEDLSQERSLVSEVSQSRGELPISAMVFEKDNNRVLKRQIGENRRKQQSSVYEDFGGALQDSSSMGRPMGVLREDLSGMSELKKRRESMSKPFANERTQRTYAEERNDYTCEDGDSSSSTLLVDVKNVRRHKRRETVDGEAVDHVLLSSREEEKGGNRIDYVGSLSPVRKSGGKSSLSVLKDNEVSIPTAPKNSEVKGHLSKAQEEPSHARMGEDLNQKLSLARQHLQSRGELSLVTSHEDLGRERSAVYPVIKRQKVGLNVNSEIVFNPPSGKRGGRRSTANDNLSLLGNVRNSSAVKRLGKEKVYPVHDDSVVAEVGGIRPLASFTESSSEKFDGTSCDVRGEALHTWSSSVADSVSSEPVPVAHSTAVEARTTSSKKLKEQSETYKERSHSKEGTSANFSEEGEEFCARFLEEAEQWERKLADAPQVFKPVKFNSREYQKKREQLKFKQQKMFEFLVKTSANMDNPVWSAGKKKGVSKTIASKGVKKVSAKRKFTEMFTVNGKPYKPHLAKPAWWVTDRLYNRVIKASEPKHGLRARVVAEEVVIAMSGLVSQVMKDKNSKPKTLDKLRKVLYRAGLITSFMDYILFCRDFFPKGFIDKGVPAMQRSIRLPVPDNMFTDLNL